MPWDTLLLIKLLNKNIINIIKLYLNIIFSYKLINIIYIIIALVLAKL